MAARSDPDTLPNGIIANLASVFLPDPALFNRDDVTVRNAAVRATLHAITTLQRKMAAHAERLLLEHPREVGELAKNLAVALQNAVAAEQSVSRIGEVKVKPSGPGNDTDRDVDGLVDGLTEEAWLACQAALLRKFAPRMSDDQIANTARQTLALVRQDAELVRMGLGWRPSPDAASRLRAGLARFAAGTPVGEHDALPPIDPNDPLYAPLMAIRRAAEQTEGTRRK